MSKFHEVEELKQIKNGGLAIMDNYFSIPGNVYSRLSDDLSKSIYRAGLSYNLTKDERCLDSTISNLFCKQCLGELMDFCHSEDAYDICIFGIGTWGTRMFDICTRNKININSWIDNFGSISSKSGLNVYRPAEFQNPDKIKVIIAVENNSAEILEQLLKLGFINENIYDLGAVIKAQAKILETRQYFDLPEMKPGEKEVFVDCGAFDGMSTERFAQWAGKYDRVYMFEANMELSEKCKAVADRHKNCVLINKGVWNEEKELVFYESPYDGEYNVDIGMHNCLDELQKNEKWIIHRIPVIRMDDVIEGPVSFIKMDIEGSEAAAIQGAKRLISTYKPKCAISVYHKPDDLWIIPKLLLEYNSDYRFWLRHYSLGWGETVLYAI